MLNKAAVFSFLLIFSLFWGCSNTVGTEKDTISSTTISFSLEESSHVKLWIENAYQTRVITIIDEERDAGLHSVSFKMVDSKGNSLPNGLYTYHLKSDSFSTSRTIILR
jgi:flagellar hook assembly protein FlgD